MNTSNAMNSFSSIGPPQASGGNSQQSDEAELWGCSKCTFKNHPDLKTCEVCETSRHNFVSVENGILLFIKYFLFY